MDEDAGRKRTPTKPAYCLLVLLVASLAGCGPKIDVSATVEDGQVVFHIPHRGVNGLLSFRVEDEEGEPLWHVRLDYFKGNRIVYGVVPDGEASTVYARTEQLWPGAYQPPPNIRGKTVSVTIDYQYDTLTANASRYTTKVNVP